MLNITKKVIQLILTRTKLLFQCRAADYSAGRLSAVSQLTSPTLPSIHLGLVNE